MSGATTENRGGANRSGLSDYLPPVEKGTTKVETHLDRAIIRANIAETILRCRSHRAAFDLADSLIATGKAPAVRQFVYARHHQSIRNLVAVAVEPLSHHRLVGFVERGCNLDEAEALAAIHEAYLAGYIAVDAIDGGVYRYVAVS